MLIWKPPAVLIIGANLVGFGALMFVFSTLLEVIKPGNGAGAVFFCAVGIGTIITDMLYRKRQELSLGSLETSTVFFVIPTWVAGIVLFFMGLSILAR